MNPHQQHCLKSHTETKSTNPQRSIQFNPKRQEKNCSLNPDKHVLTQCEIKKAWDWAWSSLFPGIFSPVGIYSQESSWQRNRLVHAATAQIPTMLQQARIITPLNYITNGWMFMGWCSRKNVVCSRIHEKNVVCTGLFIECIIFVFYADIFSWFLNCDNCCFAN